MSRIKRGVIHTKKRKKVLKLVKGYRGGRSKLYVLAKEALKKALFRSYIDRRRKKRDFRRLWITRINAAARQQGLSYNLFMKGLQKSNINFTFEEKLFSLQKALTKNSIEVFELTFDPGAGD